MQQYKPFQSFISKINTSIASKFAWNLNNDISTWKFINSQLPAPSRLPKAVISKSCCIWGNSSLLFFTNWKHLLTSSSAVAEKPRAALCPSVVSFNSVTHRAPSFIVVISASDLPLRTIECCSVVSGVTLRLDVINTSSSSPEPMQTNAAAYQQLVSSTCHGPT